MNDIIEYISHQGIALIIFTLFGAFLKSFYMTIHNQLFTKKLLNSIKESSNIRKIIQNTEKSRIMFGAERVIVTQIHNGGRWMNGKSMIKLSTIYDLSLSGKDDLQYHNFDSQIKDILITDLYPIVYTSASSKKIDIASISDLKESQFSLYYQCKLDSINYISTVNIEHRNKILGFIFFIFTGDQIPNYSKETKQELKELGQRIGMIMK